MMGSGLFNTFVSIRLEMEGYAPEIIGIVTSALYLGILIGSLKIDRWVSKAGHIRAFVVLATVPPTAGVVRRIVGAVVSILARSTLNTC